MQTPYPSVHFPLLLVCRPRSLEEKTRMPASPAKRSCGASSPEAQRGTVCGRRPLGTLGWRGLGARIPAFGLHASVCSSDEPTGWPCRVCVCARVCGRAHAQANQDRSGRYCCRVWWDFVAQHHCGARALSSSLNWMQPRVSLVMGQGWIVC